MHQGFTASEVVTGKPVGLGGSAGRRAATGRGVSLLIGEAMKVIGITPSSATAVVQGFGNVGFVTAEILQGEMGVKVVGLSHHSAAYFNPTGLPIHERHAARLAWNRTDFRTPWWWLEATIGPPAATCERNASRRFISARREAG